MDRFRALITSSSVITRANQSSRRLQRPNVTHSASQSKPTLAILPERTADVVPAQSIYLIARGVMGVGPLFEQSMIGC